MFCTNISEHCVVIETAARARQEDIRRVIADELDRVRILSESVANDTPAAGGSSAVSGYGGSSSGAVTFSN